MLDLVHCLAVVLEEGSLNRAARRLHMTQPTLTRKMQALEHELGGAVLEREPTGVTPTALGHETVAQLGALAAQVEAAVANLRRLARGQCFSVRLGYLGSAAQLYVDPALAQLRREHPEARVTLLDQSPGEQIAALRRGELDVALIGQEGALFRTEFHARKLATLGVCAALPHDHPLAGRESVALAELRREIFIGAAEADVPGRNEWMARLCRRAGFRPRLAGDAASVSEAFTRIASEGCVTLLPDYFAALPHPAAALVRVSDAGAAWDLHVLRQRGRAPVLVTALLRALAAAAEASQARCASRARR